MKSQQQKHMVIFDYLLIDDVLRKTGLLDHFNNGGCECNFCKSIIRKNDIGCIVAVQNNGKKEFVPFCKSFSCRIEAQEMARKG